MSRKLTIKEVKHRSYNINKNIKILSTEYINAKEHLICECLIDHHIWSVNWSNLSQGRGCPKCAKREKMSIEDAKSKLKIINPNIEIISKTYVNAHKKLKCRCLIDGNVWSVTWGDLSQGAGCKICGTKSMKEIQSLSIDEIKERNKTINSNVEIVSDTYVNNREKLKCKCLICNKFFNKNWAKLSQGHGCPKCKLSIAEKQIDQQLIDDNYHYTSQYRIKDCRNKNPLPFDFAIFEDKEKTILKCLIEYDGIQHYREVSFTNNKIKSMENFLKTQKHDGIKNNYCANNKIPLLRIPYWEKDNIKDIIDNFLLKLDIQEAI